jgi:hypothetical protein
MAGALLTLRDFVLHHAEPANPDAPGGQPLNWIALLGRNPGDLSQVLLELREVVEFGQVQPSDAAAVLPYIFRLAGDITMGDVTRHVEDADAPFPGLTRDLVVAITKIRAYGWFCELFTGAASDGDKLCLAALEQVGNFNTMLMALRSVMLGRVVHEPDPVADGAEEDGARVAAKPNLKMRLMYAMKRYITVTGTHKGAHGEILKPVFHTRPEDGLTMYCHTYEPFGNYTHGDAEPFVHHVVELLLNPAHPQAHHVRGLCDDNDLTSLFGDNYTVSEVAKWVSNRQHGVIPTAEMARGIVTVLVDGEPTIFWPGRTSFPAEPDPERVTWPALIPVRDFRPEEWGYPATAVSRIFLEDEFDTGWLHISERLSRGQHPVLLRELGHADNAAYTPGYTLHEVRWVDVSMQELMRRCGGAFIWKETPTSTPGALQFVVNTPAAVEFREAEQALLTLLFFSIRTPVFDTILTCQGYHLRALMIALYRIFGYANVPVQSKDPRTGTWHFNDSSHMNTFIWGLPKTGKSCLCHTVRSCFLGQHIYEMPANAGSDQWFYLKQSAHLNMACELGDGKQFERSWCETDLLAMLVGEPVTEKRKNEHPDPYPHPEQPNIFAGNGAPHGSNAAWMRRFFILGFTNPFGPGQQRAELGLEMEKERASLLVKGAILYRYYLNVYTKDQLSDPYVWLPMMFSRFRTMYMSESHRLACFILDPERWEIVDGGYTRLEVINELYRAWLADTNTGRPSTAPACNERTMQPLCEDNGLVLRPLTAEEMAAEQLAIPTTGRRHMCVERLRYVGT